MDCPDPRALADFYAGLIGGDVAGDDEDWVVLNEPNGPGVPRSRGAHVLPGVGRLARRGASAPQLR
ncbi:VOC family protein [Mycolicibacterium lacusdiani]|uniref:VOC family protein n=1 Tax=Mycolicibacterium lacusdiani TaxID=2895283 RepID=UPI00355788DC